MTVSFPGEYDELLYISNVFDLNPWLLTIFRRAASLHSEVLRRSKACLSTHPFPLPLTPYLPLLQSSYAGSEVVHQIEFEVGVVKLAKIIINVILEVCF